jgi:hypothetical protein
MLCVFAAVNIAGARYKVKVFKKFCCSRVGEGLWASEREGGEIKDWRNLYSEEIHDLCFSPHKI